MPPRKPKPCVPLYSEELAAFEEQMRAQGLVPVTLYTDGSCPENALKPGEAAMGVGVVAISGTVRKEWSEPAGLGSNQIAELLAIFLGLSKIKQPGHCGVRIYCDNEYAIGCLTANWTLKKNIEIAQRTRALYEALAAAEMIHIKGHTGVEGNERADRLAGHGRATETARFAAWRDGTLYRYAPDDGLATLGPG